MALKDIKAKIGATHRTHKVTRAMEAVSAVKMRKTQTTAFAGRPYARAALSILTRLSGSKDVSRHPLAQVRAVRKTALILITSDKGLAGALNSGVIKAAIEVLQERSPDTISVYAYGKKGQEAFSRRGYSVVQSFENKKDEVELSVMESLVATVGKAFSEGAYDEVLVAYSNFKSTFEQQPTLRRLLPLAVEDIAALVKDILPEKGKFTAPAVLEKQSTPVYTFEPDSGEILNVLVPRLVSVSLYHMLLEAKASEHSARMVAMKNASDKSKEVAHDLTRLFNKIRQAAITREVSEIVGGREALAT